MNSRFVRYTCKIKVCILYIRQNRIPWKKTIYDIYHIAYRLYNIQENKLLLFSICSILRTFLIEHSHALLNMLFQSLRVPYAILQSLEPVFSRIQFGACIFEQKNFHPQVSCSHRFSLYRSTFRLPTTSLETKCIVRRIPHTK